MDNVRRQRDELQRKLERTAEQFGREYQSISSEWDAKVGPFTISTTLRAPVIAASYIAFNMTCLALGIVFIFLKPPLQTLGISLVIGGLFSFGSFTAQWWNHAWLRTHTTLDRAFNLDYRDRRYAELQRLAKEFDELDEKLSSLSESPSELPHQEDSVKKRNELDEKPSSLPVPPHQENSRRAARKSRRAARKRDSERAENQMKGW